MSADGANSFKSALSVAVLHQVSKVHTESIAKRLGLPLDVVPVIYPEHGNVGPASVPMTLASYSIPSWVPILMTSASSTTWLLVRM